MSCRICLSETTQSESVNIFTKGRSNETISDLIMNFAYIEVFEEDNLPDVVCLLCLNHLNKVYEFRDLIIKSDAHLKEMRNKIPLASEDENNCIKNVSNEQTQFSQNEQYQPMVQCVEAPTNFVSLNDVMVCENKNVTQNETNDFKNKRVSYSINDEDDVRNCRRGKTKKYKCDQCQSSFKNRYKLILHKTVHTGIFPHSCDICNKGFPTNWSMNVHRRIHFEERPFQCDLCDKSFKSKSAQIIHRKIHLGIKSYQCKVCGKQFVQMGGLRAHQYTHTSEKPLVYIPEFIKALPMNHVQYVAKCTQATLM
ncbi:zinc finger protein 81-like isoform X2 [Zophobas morio]|uniref:zinc finger protein 81-like isoform X2 n=1 Tax=Zophobas morio TaxID=2755281 RepID=UPI00308275DC